MNLVQVMEAAGSRKVTTNGGEISGTCPFHKDNSPSFSMNTLTGLFTCYSAACGASGTLVMFLMKGLGWPFKKAQAFTKGMGAVDFREDPSIATLPAYEKRKNDVEVASSSSITEGALGMYDFCPRYMLNRGYDKKTLRKWGIGFDHSSRRVVFPVRKKNGELIGITKRLGYDGGELPYLHLGFKKGSLLYGEHLVDTRNVVVVEGQTDTLAFDQLYRKWLTTNGYSVVSTLGAKVSREQINRLAKYSRVVLAFDHDRDGEKASRLVGQALVSRLRPNSVFRLTEWSGHKDPGSFLGATEQERRTLIGSLVDYNDYVVSALKGRK